VERSLQRLSVHLLQRVFCEAWLEGLSISQLPDIPGVSRPTYYRMLRGLLESEPVRVRFAPNLRSLGLRALLVENPSGGAMDLGSLRRYSLLYLDERSVEEQASLLQALGLRVTGPLDVEAVYCPASRRVVRAPPPLRATYEERALASAVSKRFTSTREVAERVGLSWQRVSWLLQQPRMRRILITPLVYVEPSARGAVGAALELEAPPRPGGRVGANGVARHPPGGPGDLPVTASHSSPKATPGSRQRRPRPEEGAPLAGLPASTARQVCGSTRPPSGCYQPPQSRQEG
jgi:hypothetical protein